MHAGRVVQETQNGHVVESRYDPMGRRQELRSSLGTAIAFERDVMGRLTRTKAGGWQQHIQRDANGLEIQRVLSGGLHSAWQRDTQGRPSQQRVMHGSRTVHQRRYRWHLAGELAEIEDSFMCTLPRSVSQW